MQELLIPLLEFPARYLYYSLCFLLGWFLTVSLPRFVMCQDIFLRLTTQNEDVVFIQLDWLYTVTGGFNHHRDAPTFHAAHDERCLCNH